ncbi:MAG TPA: 30S ribosomal protein S20 [Pirellulales bacterium]|jgi:small subunit ribosomal protein S20|nr:30S ribosomal protein S20 [Pirellulales bacterium]
MPNTKSAKKRLKQSLVRRARNRATKSALKTHIRRVREAMKAGDAEKAATEFRLAVVHFDKAAGHGVIHANAAARVKSRLSAALKAAKHTAKPAAAPKKKSGK